jgi:hypothetical protein
MPTRPGLPRGQNRREIPAQAQTPRHAILPTRRLLNPYYAVLFNMSGHGHFDMAVYIAYFDGKLVDQDYDERELAMAHRVRNLNLRVGTSA